MAGLVYTLGLNAGSLVSGFSSAAGLLGAFNSRLGSMAGLSGGLVSVDSAIAGIGKAINEAASMEGFETTFEVLLGSADKAQARMEQLSKFAASTPFELPEVAQASRTLETLTNGALSTGDGLRLVGDVASGTQQPFGEISNTIGKLYSGLQNGRPVGEVMSRLVELGAITDDAAARIGEMQGQGMKGDAVWQVAAASMGKFSGEMDKQSNTWNGKMSTLQDSVNGIFRAFGTPLIDALKPMLTAATEMAESLAPMAKELGEGFSQALGIARELFASGQLGKALSLSLQIGFGEAINFGAGLFGGLIQAASTALVGGFITAIKLISSIAQPNFWTGLGQALLAAATSFGAKILADTADVIRGVSRLPGFGDLAKGADKLDAVAEEANAVAAELWKGAGKDLQPIFSEAGERLKVIGEKMGEGIKDSIATTKPIDNSAKKKELDDMVSKASASMQAKKEVKPEVKPKPQEGNGNNGSPGTSPAKALQASPADKLAKAGIFIGGAGGPRGQKSGEQTAKNTSLLLKEQQKMNTRWEQIHAEMKQGSGTKF